MLIVTVMLVILFTSLTTIMSRSMIKERVSTMHRIAEDPTRKYQLRNPGENTIMLPYFVLEYDTKGELQAYGDSRFDLSDMEELKTLYEKARTEERPEGVLEEYALRYVTIETPHGQKQVYTDMSQEKTMVYRFAKLSFFLGIATFAILLGTSVLMSGWATRPVSEAWEKQKQFVADASHELKTPISVIMANAELLQQMNGDEVQQKKYMDNILAMSYQMRRLVGSLLDLARLDKSETDDGKEKLLLSEIVENCILSFEPLYYERGLTLEYEIEPELYIRADEREIRQCMDIFLDNAQKYSEKGAVKLKLTRVGHHAELTVRNPSPELSKNECKDIFKRFYRRDKARTSSGSYGLGLPIAESIAANHGGKIVCTWEAGEICFTMTMPLL